jgi:hypothetical protein
MRVWKLSDAQIKFPLLAKRDKRKIGSEFFTDGGVYYSSAARFPGEYLSEFGMNSEGKCFYTAYIGVYNKETIDEPGKKLAQKIRDCIWRSDWDINEIEDDSPGSKDFYLSMTYKPVDNMVYVMRKKNKDTDNYSLVITMFRFTPLK